ncbi:hypothetical protein ATY77_11475 [Rhizobium sp. R634]|uniref:hypothetical protein n=1 Tax=Rhizobium sp. R634 TaxID=1764274 RepID=UPI000B69F0C9|nr:hypothetical protein [Rhizobium sp. R634]OWV72142.1 hypothetical protein ATY77_11475 [Rhizobium sp. R634]
MGFDRIWIQAAFLCSALAMPGLGHGAEASPQEAFLTRISTEIVPRMQREYLRATLRRYGEGTVIDLAAYAWSENFERWYIEGMFDGTTAWPHTSTPGEEPVTGEVFELWQFSPFVPYYLEVTEIPDCPVTLSDGCPSP